MIDQLLPQKAREKLRRFTSQEGNRRLLTGGVITTACRFLGIAVLLVTHALNTRLMAKEDVGVYFTLWSAATFLAVIGPLGLRTSVVSWIADAEKEQNLGLARSAISTTLGVTHCSFLAIGAVLCAGFVITSLFYSLPIFSLQGGVLYALWVFTLGTSYAVPEIFRGFHRYLPAGIFSGLLIAALNSLALGWLWMTVGSATLQQVMLVNVISGSLNYLICMGLIGRLMRQLPLGKPLLISQALQHSLPIMVANASRAAFEVLDAVVVGFVAGPEQAALYGPAGRLAALLNIPNQIMVSTFSPAIAQAHAHDQKSRLERILRGASTVAAIPGLACTALFVLAGKQVLNYGCGPEYGAAAPALTWLVLGNLFQLLTGAAGLALILGNQQRVAMRLNTIVTVLTLGSIMCVSGWFGATGAAFVRAIMMLILAVLQQTACRRLLGVASSPYLIFPPKQRNNLEADASRTD